MTLTAYCLIYNGWIGEDMGGFGVMESFCLCSVSKYICEVVFLEVPSKKRSHISRDFPLNNKLQTLNRERICV